jgi:hypothetical protein
MDGIDIFSRNRSKCGIRGTWQARIRFTNVKVPRKNLLHQEGRGLNIALSCLNYGRCTLSAGMLGGARYAMEQAGKWSSHRHQFDRPICDFELVQQKLARMGAYVYAMDAMLYMTTGFLDRHDEDIMLETAICKVFCSEYGYRVVDDCMQVMGGESYITANEIERIWRDSRINIIVEGANEVMHSFVFAYGSKQLGEYMIGIKKKPLSNFRSATRIALELFLGIQRQAPKITKLPPELQHFGNSLMKHIQQFSHQVKQMFRKHQDGLIANQSIQERLSMTCIWIHAMNCVLSKLDSNMSKGISGKQLEYEKKMVEYCFALGHEEIGRQTRGLRSNSDGLMRETASQILKQVASLPNSNYSIPEQTPVEGARGSGMNHKCDSIQDFGSGSTHEPNSTESQPHVKTDEHIQEV